MIKSVAIAGLGLVGGSLGMALKAAKVQVVGVDPGLSADEAIGRGACDAFADGLDKALETGPEILALAGGVDRIEAALESLTGRALPAGLAVTDVGSVKTRICELGRRLPRGGAIFVGGHPLAGGERSGIAAARPDLFRGAPWVLVPPSGIGAAQALGRVREMAVLAGARTVEMAAERHDRIVATTSHLPHLLAAALAAHLGGLADRDAFLVELTGRGFLDMTRIADGPSEVWRPILESNKENIRAALESVIALLEGPVAPLLDAGRAARERLRARRKI
jgi:prephenate dehydrogenase